MELKNGISFEEKGGLLKCSWMGGEIWHAFSTHLSWFSRSGI